MQAGKVVVVDLRLFRIRTFGAGNVVALVVSLGEFGLLFALPLFLQATRGYDALETGVILLALAIGSFVASGLGAPLSQRMGPVRVLQLGMALEAIGIIGLGFILSTTVTGWQMAPWLFIYGMGVGFATAQLTGVILCEVPVAESGQASAVQSTSRQVGAAIGTAIIGATLIFGLGSVASQLEDRGVPAEQAAQVSDAVASSAGQAIPGLAEAPGGDVLVEGASAGFADAIKLVAWVAGAFVFVGLLMSLLLPKNAARVESEGYAPPHSHEDDPEQGVARDDRASPCPVAHRRDRAHRRRATRMRAARRARRPHRPPVRPVRRGAPLGAVRSRRRRRGAAARRHARPALQPGRRAHPARHPPVRRDVRRNRARPARADGAELRRPVPRLRRRPEHGGRCHRPGPCRRPAQVIVAGTGSG